MEEIMALIGQYGLDTCLLALFVSLSTGAAKIPLKILSAKRSLGNALNKYITLLPLVFGFLYAGLYQLAVTGKFFSESTAVLATTSASLSLAVYAILEKFFMKNGDKAAARPVAGEGVAATGQTAATEDFAAEGIDATGETAATKAAVADEIIQTDETTAETKIILGKRNDETDAERA